MKNFVKVALNAGADILIIGRAITASKNVGHADDEFLEQMDREEMSGSRTINF
jgi:bifunctional enzyme Fae/Hps